MDDAPILVTGGSGFLGSHTVLELLKRGHTVRTTVRSRERREPQVRKMLADAGLDANALERLAFVEAHDVGQQPRLPGALLVEDAFEGQLAVVAGERIEGQPLAYFMGVPFPAALANLSDTAEDLVPGGGGTNGCASAATRSTWATTASWATSAGARTTSRSTPSP